MMVWKMMFLFQGCILRFHVNLPGCITYICTSNSIFFLWKISASSPGHWHKPLLGSRFNKGIYRRCVDRFDAVWNPKGFLFHGTLYHPYLRTELSKMLPLWQQGYLRNIFQRNCCRSSADQSIFHSLAINLFWNVWKIQKEANLKSTNHNNRKSSPFFQEINPNHNIIHLDLWCISKPAVFVYRVPHLLFIGPNCLGRTLLFCSTWQVSKDHFRNKTLPTEKRIYHGSLTW